MNRHDWARILTAFPHRLQTLLHRGHFSRRKGGQRPISNTGTVQRPGLVRYDLTGLEQSVPWGDVHAPDFEGRVNFRGHRQHDNQRRELSTQLIGLHDDDGPDLADLLSTRRIEIRGPDFSPAHHFHQLSPDSSSWGALG